MTFVPVPPPRRGALLAWATILAALALPAGTLAQDLPLVTPDDYGRWERLGQATLSPHGSWIAYSVSRVDETAELRLRKLDEDSTRVFPWGTSPSFSPDGRWFAWTAGVSPEERERLARSEEPVRSKTMLMDLGTGETREFQAVSSRSFDPTGRFLALRGTPPGQPPGRGADLRVFDLADGTANGFGNVAEMAWSPEGPLLAMVIATGGDVGNGVQLYDAATGTLRSADASGSRYQSLRWRDDSNDLAVLRSREDASADGTAYDVLAWRDADRGEPATVLDGGTAGVPDTLEVVRARAPVWSDDGTMISVGLRPAEAEEEEEEAEGESDEEGEPGEGEPGEGEGEPGEGEPDEEEPGDEAADRAEEEPELPGLQIWHTKDIDIFPAQRLAESWDANRTLLAVWRLDEDRVVVVGSDLELNARLLHGWEVALEDTNKPYPWGTMFGRPYRDVWAIDVSTGERREILTRVRHAWPSAGGGWMLWWDGADYHSLNLRTGARHNLTAELDTDFSRTDYDTPTDLTPPRSFAPDGWLEGDATVFLRDHHDIWRIALDGSGGERLTRGAESGVIHGFVRLAPDDGEPGFDPGARPYLSLYNESTEERGYARFGRGWSTPETLILEHAGVGGLTRADSADVMLYRVTAFDDPPDYFLAGPDLADATQVTEINPFISEVAWGPGGAG